MQCDLIAPVYRLFEYGAFGRTLERHRFFFLPQVSRCRRALLLADGDGRFAAKLLQLNPTIQIDSFEISQGMINQARHRLGRLPVRDAARIRLRQANALSVTLPAATYDLVVTNFFFDCFSSRDIAALVARIRPACKPGAIWLVSEFRQPAQGWPAWHARLCLTVMYLFFRIATGLRTSSLQDHRAAMMQTGFRLEQTQSSRAGLIASELWCLERSKKEALWGEQDGGLE